MPFLAKKKKCQKNAKKNGQIFWPTFLKRNLLVFSKKNKKTQEKKKCQKNAGLAKNGISLPPDQQEFALI